MAEHRRSPRRRTLKGETILFGTTTTIDCVVRNLSETGASLEVETYVGIPANFTLLIKRTYHAQVPCDLAIGKKVGRPFRLDC
jgi:hypothetical protein